MKSSPLLGELMPAEDAPAPQEEARDGLLTSPTSSASLSSNNLLDFLSTAPHPERGLTLSRDSSRGDPHVMPSPPVSQQEATILDFAILGSAQTPSPGAPEDVLAALEASHRYFEEQQRQKLLAYHKQVVSSVAPALDSMRSELEKMRARLKASERECAKLREENEALRRRGKQKQYHQQQPPQQQQQQQQQPPQHAVGKDLRTTILANAALSPRSHAESHVAILRKLRGVPFKETGKNHRALLARLWTQLFPEAEALSEVISPKWKLAGFSMDNPAIDFQSSGVLGLQNLDFFVNSNLAYARQVVASNRYPFCSCGLRITSGLFYALGLQKGDVEHQQSLRALVALMQETHKAFEEIYCISFLMFDARWSSPRECDEALEGVVRDIVKALGSNPTSILDLKRLLGLVNI